MSEIENQCNIEIIPKKRGRKPYLTDEERQQRRESRLERQRILYKEKYGPNRDKKIRGLCECGENILLTNAYRHYKTKKHLSKIEAINKLENSGL